MLLSNSEDLRLCTNALSGLYRVRGPEHDTTSDIVVNLFISDVFSLNSLLSNFSACAKTSTDFNRSPILLLASASELDALDQGLLTAVDDIIYHPAQPVELKQRVRRQLLYSGRQKHAEEALRQERSFSSVILDSLPGVFYLYDENRRFLRWNRDFERVTGYTGVEIRKMSPLEFFAGEEKELLARRIQEVFDRTASSVEANFVTRDGRQIPYFFTGRRTQFGGRTCLLGVGVDITERKRAEEALSASEIRLRLSTEMAGVAVWEYHVASNTMARSDNHDRLYGLPTQERWEIETFVNATHPEDRQHSFTIIEKAIAAGGQDVYSFDFRVVHPDRTVHWLSVTGQVAERDAAGMGTIVRGCLVDITERKLAENQALASERRFRFFFENSMDAILLSHPDGRIASANPAAEAMFGMNEQEIIELGRGGLVDPKDPRLHDLLARREKNGKAVGELTLLRGDGTRFEAELASALYRDEEGLVRSSMIIRDITERRQAESELRWRAEELTTLNRMGRAVNKTLSIEETVSAALDNVINHTNPDLTFIFLRDGMEMHMIGFRPESAADIIDTFPPHRIGECFCGGAIEKGEPIYSRDINLDVRYTHREFKQAGIRSFVAIPLSVGAEVIGVIGLASRIERDFLEQEYFLETLAGQVAAGLNNAMLHEKIKDHAAELEQRVARRTIALSKALDKATAAERLKSIFLASMSHELRTPLNSIIGFTGILLMGLTGTLNPEQHKQLQMVKTNGQHLLSMINDILDISKIEAGKILPEIETFDLDLLVKEVIDIFRLQIDEKGLNLLTRCSTPITLVSDRRRLKQILTNMVSNAVKYTTEGQITLSCSKRGVNLEVWVADTGIGIDGDNVKRLFQPFQQVDMKLTKSFEGTGLGLYLCRKLANLLGGDISVKSRLGKGSVFKVVLPLEIQNVGNAGNSRAVWPGVIP